MLALIHRKAFIGALLFFQDQGPAFREELRPLPVQPAPVHKQVIVPAAGMGAEALLCAPSVQVGAHQAAARVCDAHGPVHETFNFHVGNGILDFSNFRKACFAPHDDARKAQRPVHLDRLAVHAGSLRRKMERRPGELFLQEGNNAEVLHDEGIDRIKPEIGNLCLETVDFFVVKGDVQGAVQLPPRIGCLYRGNLPVFVCIKVIGLDAEGEVFKSDVGRVGPVGVAVAELFDIAGRRKELHAYACRPGSDGTAPATADAGSAAGDSGRGEKSGFLALQIGQTQLSSIASKGVPGAISSSLSPCSGS